MRVCDRVVAWNGPSECQASTLFVFGLGQSGDRAWPTVPMTMIHCDTTPVGGFCVHVCKNMEHVHCKVNENQRYST